MPVAAFTLRRERGLWKLFWMAARVTQPETGFRSGLDAVMLAAACPPSWRKRAGTGRRRGHRQPVPGGAGAWDRHHRRGDRSRPGGAGEGECCRQRHVMCRFVAADIFAPAAGIEARIRPCASAIRPFTATARSRPTQARTVALSDGGKLSDWLKLGLQRTVSGGYFTAILRADRLERGTGGIAAGRREHLAALAASGRTGQAGDRPAPQRLARAFCPVAGIDSAPARTGLIPLKPKPCCAAAPRLPSSRPRL